MSPMKPIDNKIQPKLQGSDDEEDLQPVSLRAINPKSLDNVESIASEATTK